MLPPKKTNLRRLKSKAVIDRLFLEGEGIHSKHLFLRLIQEKETPFVYAGVSVSKRNFKKAVDRKNDVQNNNAWFLDPVALNQRFLANDPYPDDHPLWGGNRPADTVQLRVPNMTRRWWLGEDGVSESDMDMPYQTTRDILVAKVKPTGGKN